MTTPEADVLPETFNFSTFELSYLSTLQPPHSSLSLLAQVQDIGNADGSGHR
jgi:hypothetical protein